MIIRFSWKKVFLIGRIVASIIYFLLRIFSYPEAWFFAMSALASLGLLTMTQDQQVNVSKTGVSFCSFVLHFWSNAEVQPPM